MTNSVRLWREDNQRLIAGRRCCFLSAARRLQRLNLLLSVRLNRLLLKLSINNNGDAIITHIASTQINLKIFYQKIFFLFQYLEKDRINK